MESEIAMIVKIQKSYILISLAGSETTCHVIAEPSKENLLFSCANQGVGFLSFMPSPKGCGKGQAAGLEFPRKPLSLYFMESEIAMIKSKILYLD